MKMRIIGLVTVAGALLSSVLPAAALPTFVAGSFSFAAFTSTTSNVQTTTSFAMTSDLLTGSPTGSFSALPPPGVLALPATLDSIDDFNFSDPVFGTFTAATLSLFNTSINGPSVTVSYDIEGSFVPGTGWSNSGTLFTANETWGLTQTGGAGNAISMSGTFHSPASPPQVPEPATLTILGLGLLAAGAVRRRKVS